MNRRIIPALLVLLSAGGLPLVFGDNPAAKPRIEPKADGILKKACACLAGLKQFGIKVEETFDEMSASGQKILWRLLRHGLVLASSR
jgi:hypothetical protein